MTVTGQADENRKTGEEGFFSLRLCQTAPVLRSGRVEELRAERVSCTCDLVPQNRRRMQQLWQSLSLKQTKCGLEQNVGLIIFGDVELKSSRWHEMRL